MHSFVSNDNNTDSKIACYACHKHQNIKNGHRDENLDFKLKWRGKISTYRYTYISNCETILLVYLIARMKLYKVTRKKIHRNIQVHFWKSLYRYCEMWSYQFIWFHFNWLMCGLRNRYFHSLDFKFQFPTFSNNTSNCVQ